MPGWVALPPTPSIVNLRSRYGDRRVKREGQKETENERGMFYVQEKDEW